MLRAAKDTLAKTKYLLLEITIHKNPNYTVSSLLSLLSSDLFEFQLIHVRDWDHTEDGKIWTLDCFFKNIQLESYSQG